MRETSDYLKFRNHTVKSFVRASFLALGFLFMAGGTVLAQQGIAPTTVPAGGCAIDGNLLAKTPVTPPFSTGTGDFLPNDGASGTGGSVFSIAGVPLDTATSFHPVDAYGSADANIFTGGSKFNNDPNTWKWKSGQPPAKDDINHSLFFFSSDASGNLWFVGCGDRKSTNGNTYLDFELLQNTLVKNPNGTFSSEGPDGGRTVGDLSITVWYTNGGSWATLYIYKWSATGTNSFGYVQVIPAAGTAFLATNKDSAITVPYGAFGSYTYPVSAFTEVACNLNDLVQGSNNCVNIKTVIVKTKASQSINAELKDFIEPVQVIANSAPVISVNSDTVCYGETATLTVSVLSGTGPFSFLWSTGDTTQSITVSPDTTTQYTVVVTGANGCPSAPATSTVTVLPLPVVEISGPDTICNGNTASLTADVVSGTGPYTYLWNTGDTTQTITVAPDTTSAYSVVVTGGNGCPSEPADFTLTVIPLPVVMIEGADTLCIGDSTILTANVLSGTGPYVYSWNTGDTTQSITVAPDATTLYSVVVTGFFGCSSDTAWFTVNVFTASPCSINGPDTICPAGTAEYSGPDSLASYTWTITGNGTIQGGANAQTVIVQGTGGCDSTFTLTLVTTSGAGCPNTCTKTVIMVDTISPVITDVPADITVLCASMVPPAGSDTVTVTDNCEGDVTLMINDSVANQTCPNRFTVIRTWTAVDLCGNSATALQTITVFDSLAPVLNGVPVDTGVCCADSIPLPANVTAYDSCQGAVEVELTEVVSDSTGPNFFTLTRTWTAQDSCGNIVSDSQVIQVNDTLFEHGGYPQGTGSARSAIVKFAASPNPFIYATNITFLLARDANATVEIYNLVGLKMKTLFNGSAKAGTEVKIKLAPDPAMGPGMYLLVLRTEYGAQTMHLVLTR